MSTAVTTHIRIDENGVAWIDDTRIKVIEVAIDKIAYDSSPEEMHHQYPHLSLAQIHAALAHYYDHKAEFDAAIAQELREVDELRKQAGESPVHKRLREMGFALTEDLRLHGVDVLTAQEDGTTEISDSELLDRATSLDRVVFSHDKDFLREASKRQQSGQFFAGVIYAHQIRVTMAQCINDLELITQVGNPEDLANRVIHLPLK
jgi:uncharacterized protein (DUF433 family)/predicted nuclease of predicted toxin-antitoxin system